MVSTAILHPDAHFMTRNSTVADRKTIRTSVLLSEGAHLQVQALADANSVSAAWVIRLAIQRFLQEQGGQLELPLRTSPYKESDSDGQ